MSYTPDQPNIYKGKQVIINSDRLLFNAKEDSILLIADKAIAFNTRGTINFDTGTNSKDNKFIVNSPNIHLGLKIDNNFNPPTEPAVLGNRLEEVLELLIQFLEIDLVTFLRAGYVLKIPGGATAGATKSSNAGFSNLHLKLKQIKKLLKNFKSNTVKLT